MSQQTGDVDEDVFKAEKAAGHVSAPMMAGLAELLHTLGLDSPTHNPFVDAAPPRGAPPCSAAGPGQYWEDCTGAMEGPWTDALS